MKVKLPSAEPGCLGGIVTRHHLGFITLATCLCAAPLAADDGVFDQYRDLMGDDNPAVFVIDAPPPATDVGA